MIKEETSMRRGPLPERPGSLHSKRKKQTLFWWLGLGTGALLAGLFMQSIRLPGGWLIGPLLVAIVAGVARPGSPRLPHKFLLAGQAVIGMLLTSTFRPEVLPLVAFNWLPVLLIVAATLGVSLVAGILLARISPLSRETALFGTLPGGAMGMIALSLSSNADTRMVALMQYTRFVLVVLSAALLAGFVLHPAGVTHQPTIGMPTGQNLPHLWSDYILTAILAGAGTWAGIRLKIPAGGFLGPVILGVVASGLNFLHPVWPPGFAQAAYIIMGLYIGLLFDRASLRLAGRLIPLIMANMLVIIAICAATGWILANLTGSDYLTGYLATTPGGMDSLAVVALNSGADVSLMLSVQTVRLLASVFAGPVIARWLLRYNG
jgi:uncharacterized protein